MKIISKSLYTLGFAAMAILSLPTIATAAGHAYIGAELGIGSTNSEAILNKYLSGTIHFSSDTLGQAGVFGGYDFDDTFGAEIGYNDYSSNEATINSDSITWSGHTWDFLGVARKHFRNSNWEVYGKAGLAYESTDIKIQTSSLNKDYNAAAFAPELVGGAAYSFNAHWAANASYAYIFSDAKYGDPNDSKQAGVSMFSAGVAYKF